MKKTLITLFGLSSLLLSFTQDSDLKISMERGKEIYESQCISCHMPQGEGVQSVFPPLAKSDYLNEKNRLVKTVLRGVRGPIKVNNVEYNGEMAGFTLSDREAADLLNYVRNSWGNKGKVIVPAEIQPALRAEIKGYQPY